MAKSIQSLIAASVNGVLRELYPDRYSSLCHVHAVVGSNLISIVFNRVYRPVAGLAVIDCGGGQMIRLIDNTAFANPAGGAFHCWIESADPSMTVHEIVDLTFRHNHEYAVNNGYAWTRQPPPPYLWGPSPQILVKGELDALPESFDEGRVWLRETDEGWNWMTRHVADNMSAYATLTAHALKRLQRDLPANSTLLEDILPPADDITDSARASAPSPA
ncbi:hypothetical protein E4L96_16935 [Massilia arenosa]|uniref:Uncharacterized protein n=1 Tax=Zemynaea arenosa TaxID=2561931 RepID=A0A4Y9S4D5_9BURK|nr:hypothetical protein [Massilia arenosa]TFW16209.1 hypothetical protein E4L96_16935 [Massilia arenosa]